jgi:hypothetical protein
VSYATPSRYLPSTTSGVSQKERSRSWTETVCTKSFFIGFLVTTAFFYLSVPLPGWVLISFAVVSFLGCYIHLCRQNYLSLVVGTFLTAVFAIGILATVFDLYTPNAILTSDVVVEPIITYALLSLLGTICVFQYLTLAKAPRGWRWVEPTRSEAIFARRTVWPSLFLSIALLLLTMRGASILDIPYPYNILWGVGVGVQDSGLEALGVYLMAYSILAALRGFGYRSTAFNVCVVVVLLNTLFFRIMRGERGSSLGILLTLAILFHLASRVPHKNALFVLFSMLAAAFMQVLGHARTLAADVGFMRAIQASVQEYFIPVGKDVGLVQMLPQSFWHLLHTVDLYQLGVRRYGETYLKLPGQTIPAFLADWIGYERPIHEAWVLGEYRVHGGGFFVIAEGYWNFGYVGALLVGLFLALMCVLFERWVRRQDLVMGMPYFATLVLSVFGLAYGTQTLLRAIEVAVGMGLVFHVGRRFLLRGRRDWGGNVAPRVTSGDL